MRLGGAERAVAKLSNAWVDKGYNVVVTTMTGDKIDFYPFAGYVKKIEAVY